MIRSPPLHADVPLPAISECRLTPIEFGVSARTSLLGASFQFPQSTATSRVGCGYQSLPFAV